MTYLDPLHPSFTSAADNFRFHTEMRWVHAESIEKHGGDLEDARKWITLVWRSQPDAVEQAIIAAVVHLLDEAIAHEKARLVRAIAARHARRMMTPEQYARSAA